MTPEMKEKIWSAARHAGTAAVAVFVVIISQAAMKVDFGEYNIVLIPVLAAAIRFASKYLAPADPNA